MSLILGLDPSIVKTGFCVLDTQEPVNTFVEMGRLRTDDAGILAQKLALQAENVRALIRKHGIKLVASERYYFGGGESEQLFALHMFFHRVFLEEGVQLVYYPPTSLKSLVFPIEELRKRGMSQAGKPQMQLKCLEALGLRKMPVDDAADAFHAADMARYFYMVQSGEMESAEFERLRPTAHKYFYEKKVFKAGPRKGLTEWVGAVYRVNEFYYDFENIYRKKGLSGST